MQESNQAWIAMFRRIPADLEDTLILGLNTGVDIMLQKFLKLEPDFMIIRGRVSGTQDAGRVTLVPYGQLSFVAITKPMKDPEVDEIFGKAMPVASADAPRPVVVPPSPPVAAAPVKPAPSEPSTIPSQAQAPDAGGPRKPEPMSKITLLAKLRERLKES
jgi:hypothetical protein